MTKEFKKPDLNAPRCRAGVHKIVKKIYNRFATEEHAHDFLLEFKKKYPEHAGASMDDVMNILTTFHGKLWDHAVHNRDGVELPEGLGYIFIGTCFPAKKFNIDIANSIKNNFKTRHKNSESDNYLAKIFYTNFAKKYNFKNRELWSFKATREFKRTVAQVYPLNWKTYVQVENGKNISKYIKKARKNEYFKKLGANFTVSEAYNEFDLN